jgi:hypothetical protein
MRGNSEVGAPGLKCKAGADAHLDPMLREAGLATRAQSTLAELRRCA